MKPPEPLYPCHFCHGDYSWPASELHWSNRFKDWVCGNCWCDNCHAEDYEPDEMGVRLFNYLQDITDMSLATLRAKAKAYDEGKTIYAIFDRKGQVISYCSSALGPSLAWDRFIRVYLLSQESGIEHGYTCRKVRVCKEVEI